ncbi:MAG: thiamine pyrophosphate-dependent dehydrogenase E1 component subunit alpha [Deltaproteobacteria bacterium]|nr:thiamine pyrophosphate-dependent dehydrogenase E1 component subunit alpha [Deltaproteobacteria bacterium]
MAASKKSTSKLKNLPPALMIQIHELMVKSRVLEERLIKIYRAGESYFWIGGPGEEAWGVPLGLLVQKGQGLKYDYLHLHYRCTPTLTAMGMEMKEAIRLMMNRATDPSTGGRNFSGHYCFPKWNVAPVTSPIEVQYSISLGTAHAQKKAGTKRISIVSGGDAGTAEGDFASCLIWASRKNQELPLLITVQNNRWGISTNFEGQHGESQIADRAKAFNIRSRVVNGNDPIESYLALKEEMDYIRSTGKPSFIEAQVSRLYGHSSASGANFIANEIDCIKEFEKKLLDAGMISKKEISHIWKKYEEEGVAMAEEARSEAAPRAESIWDHVYANNENSDWRKF